MKKIYLLLILSVNLLFAQTPLSWENLNPKPTSNTGKDIIFVSETNGFYITDKEIVETKNSGETWTIIKKISSATDMDFNNNIGFIVGNGGFSYLSNDKGQTWVNLQIEQNESFIYCKVIDETTLIASSKTNIYKTTDGGATWSKKNITVYNANKIYFINQNTGFLGNTNGKMYKTTDGGTTWVLKNSVTYIPADYFTIYFYNEQLGFAERGHGELMRTADGGETWTKINGVSDHLFSFSFVTESVGYATGEDGVIFKTIDGGLTWERKFFQNGRIAGSTMFGIYFTSEDTGYVVGLGGRILKTTSSGNSYISYSLFYNTVDTINKIDNYLFAKVGWDIFKTVDEGEHWELLNRPTQLIPADPGWTTQYSRDAKFLTKDVGYIIGGQSNGDSKIFKTIDGGQSWALKQNFSVYGLNDFDFLNEQVGYVCGGQGTMGQAVYRTTDGGTTWLLVNSSIQFRKIKVFNENVVYASDYGRLYKSSDGGVNWTLLFTRDGDEIGDFHFVDENNGFIVGNPTVSLSRTTDGGATWIKEGIEYDWYKLVRFLNKNIGIVVDEEGDMLISYDGGRTWKTTPSQGIYSDLLFSGSSIYLVGGAGKVLKSQFTNIPANVIATKPVIEYFNDRAKVAGSAASNTTDGISNLKFQISTKSNFSSSIFADANLTSILGNDSDDVYADVENLQPNQIYYVRLRGEQNGQTVYGNTVNFTTKANYDLALYQPYTYGNAVKMLLEGRGSANGAAIEELEFQYSVDGIDFNKTVVSTPALLGKGVQNAALKANLMELTPNSTYFARIKGNYKNDLIY